MIEYLTRRFPMQSWHWGLVAGGALIVGVTDLVAPMISVALIVGNALFFTGLVRIVLSVAGRG
jgi:hypothetical protein